MYMLYIHIHTTLFNEHAESNYLTSDTTAIRQKQKIKRGKQYTNNRNAEDMLYLCVSIHTTVHIYICVYVLCICCIYIYTRPV